MQRQAECRIAVWIAATLVSVTGPSTVAAVDLENLHFRSRITTGQQDLGLEYYFADPASVDEVLVTAILTYGDDPDVVIRSRGQRSGSRVPVTIEGLQPDETPARLILDTDVITDNGRNIALERMIWTYKKLESTDIAPVMRLTPTGLEFDLATLTNNPIAGTLRVRAYSLENAGRPGYQESGHFLVEKPVLWFANQRFSFQVPSKDLPRPLPPDARWIAEGTIEDIWGQSIQFKIKHTTRDIDTLVSDQMDFGPAKMVFTMPGEAIRVRRYVSYFQAGRIEYSGSHRGFTYASENTDIVSIDQYGRAAALRPGKTELRVTYRGQTTVIPAEVLY